MKKLLICYMPAILAVLCMTSCQKEKMSGDGCFRARVENIHTKDAKVSFDMTNGFVWQSGDQIKVCRQQSTNSDRVYMGTYTIRPTSVNNQSTRAQFDYNNVSSEYDVTANGINDYYAYYPASIRGTKNTLNSNSKIIIPTIQTASEDGKMQGFPMYAESSTTDLDFKCLCGILRLRLSSTTRCQISRITVTTDDNHPIAGTFTMQTNTENPPYIVTGTIVSNTGKNTVTLTCPTPQTIDNTAKDFCIFLPTGDYPIMEIRIWTSDDHLCKKVFNGTNGSKDTPSTINISRSCYTSVTLSELNFNTVGRGQFTINSNGDKVMFSPGNLQYDNNSNNYLFADNDYEYRGTANLSSNVGTPNNYNGVIDLFEWNTCNAEINIAGSNWRTLSSAEWHYLVNTRNTSAIGIATDARYAKACVNNVYGLIIFPDEYEHPSDVTTPTWINNSSSNQGWAYNYYSIEYWNKMKAAGAVFLPAAGFLSYSSYSSGNAYGYYWSSSESGSNDAYCLYFGGNNFGALHIEPQTNGQSIRLVRPY